MITEEVERRDALARSNGWVVTDKLYLKMTGPQLNSNQVIRGAIEMLARMPNRNGNHVYKFRPFVATPKFVRP